ncbi:MAG: hypothetical protein GY847_13160 [Proteobacteria bacterium]|nr:hypothetical protein [Pseudomonadota bacterium]
MKSETSTHDRILELAQTFPCLRTEEVAEFLKTWNPNKLRLWSKSGMVSQKAFHAITFLLTLWNPFIQDQPYFDCMNAFVAWDEGDRKAFLAWAREPWWP